jgi:hypothetical protein
MPITSCARQQMFTVLKPVAYLRANERVHILSANHWGGETQTNLHRKNECITTPKANLLPYAMRACM